MKSILIAMFFGSLLFGAASLGFQRTTTTNRARLLFALFGCALALLIFVHVATPQDLGFLPPSVVVSSRWIDLGFSVFLFTAGFLGGLLQLYNLADRGLSLRMLIDILESPARALTAEDIARSYSAGSGINWMYQKRLDDMAAAGFIQKHGDSVSLSAKGRTSARLFTVLRDFARVRGEA
jgi:hypothetical protein